MSKNIKRIIFRRQIIYSVSFFVLELSYTMLHILSYYVPYSHKHDPLYLNVVQVLNYISMTIGIVYPLIKLTEPQFLSRMAHQF